MEDLKSSISIEVMNIKSLFQTIWLQSSSVSILSSDLYFSSELKFSDFFHSVIDCYGFRLRGLQLYIANTAINQLLPFIRMTSLRECFWAFFVKSQRPVTVGYCFIVFSQLDSTYGTVGVKYFHVTYQIQRFYWLTNRSYNWIQLDTNKVV